MIDTSLGGLIFVNFPVAIWIGIYDKDPTFFEVDDSKQQQQIYRYFKRYFNIFPYMVGYIFPI